MLGEALRTLSWALVEVIQAVELFAQLMLASQQCGVSWRVVWNKRHHYRAAFRNWDLRAVAAMGEADLDCLCDREGEWAGRVMQNRNKLNAIIRTPHPRAHTCIPIARPLCRARALIPPVRWPRVGEAYG